MSPFIEYIGTHASRPVIIRFNVLGYRCGYVGVDSNHAMYEKGYLDITGGYTPHGNFTYAGFDPGITAELKDPHGKDYWFFGFDCAHLDDAPDIEGFEALTGAPLEYPLPSFMCDGIIRSKEYVLQNCIAVAESLTLPEYDYE